MDEEHIIGYCSYCKEVILEEEDYVVESGVLYCLSCFKQINSISDNFPEEEN